MAMFRAQMSFAGLRDFEVGRLNRIMLRLGAGPGGTTHDPDSPGGDSPTSRLYIFPSVEVETVSDFTAWLRDELQQKIQTPVEFTAEKIDEETGLPLAD
jgi:hypothetical protein